MHSIAVAISQTIAIKGADSAIPAAAFTDWQKKLKVMHRHDTTLFLHLVVLFARLKMGGLLAAAEQMLALARIGLQASALDLALDHADALDKSMQGLAAPEQQAALAQAFQLSGNSDQAQLTKKMQELHAAGNIAGVAGLLASLSHEATHRPMFEALGALKRKPLALADLVAACTRDADRLALVSNFARFCALAEKQRVIALLASAGASEQAAHALLYILQFASGKHFAELAKQALEAGFGSERLMQLSDGVTLSGAKSMQQAVRELCNDS